MMRRFARLGLLGLAAAIASACGTTPPATYYTVTPVASPTGANSALHITVGPVTVAAVVDRPEIVLREGTNGLKLDDFNRWASPLSDNLTRVIAENLVVLLGTPRVTLFPPQLGVEPDLRVVVEIRAFDSTLGAAASLDAVWTIRRMKDGRTDTGRTAAREPVEGGGYAALAAAHSRALARLSTDIAAAIRALPPRTN
jgi:uncharacterized lipoprotein YmbA